MEPESYSSLAVKRICETYERESDYTEKLNPDWLKVAIDAHLSRDAVVSDEDVELVIGVVLRAYREADPKGCLDRGKVRASLSSIAARPAAVPDVIPDELKKLSEAATPGEWRSMREGNQSIGARYLPTAKTVGASRIDGPTRPWNPHAAIAFGMKAELHETVRFTDEDADFVCGAVNWVRAMLAQRDGGK